MASWSAENATKAYIGTIKMGKRVNQLPDAAEFISALAAGNNAQLMVVAGATFACSKTLALVAAANQTGGRVICILKDINELNSSIGILGSNAIHVQFVVGKAQNLILNSYSDADFVLIDCNLMSHEAVLSKMKENRKRDTVVVGYNAFSRGSWRSSGLKTQLLPIGEGLLVTKIGAAIINKGCNFNLGKKSHWIVKVDKSTGEEHVFRVRLPPGKPIEA